MSELTRIREGIVSAQVESLVRSCSLALLLLGALGNHASVTADDVENSETVVGAVTESPAPLVYVELASGASRHARLIGLRDQQLIVVPTDDNGNRDANPIPIDRVRRMTFVGADVPRALWLGKSGSDWVQVGSPRQGNGLVDWQMRVVSLPHEPIAQVRVIGHYPRWTRVWSSRPERTTHWRLHLDRPDGGAGSYLDMFFEPDLQNVIGVTHHIELVTNSGRTYRMDVVPRKSNQVPPGLSEPLRRSSTTRRFRIVASHGMELVGRIDGVREQQVDVADSVVGAMTIPLASAVAIRTTEPDDRLAIVWQQCRAAADRSWFIVKDRRDLPTATRSESRRLA